MCDRFCIPKSPHRTKKAKYERNSPKDKVHTAGAVYCLLGDKRKDFVRQIDLMRETSRAANSWETRVGESASVRRV